MENINTSVETVEVAEQPITEQVTSEVTTTESNPIDVENVANSQQETVKQSQEENAKFAAARREAEAKAKQIEAENKRLLQALNQFGYEGSASEIADLIEAQRTQKPIEQVRAEREYQEQQQIKELQTQQELEHYRSLAMQSMVQQGIDKINKAFPAANIKSINDLGEQFVKLVSAGLDEVEAYEVMQTRKARTEVSKPPITGATNNSTTASKDFYTSDEVDRLSDKDLDNPKIAEIVRKSMLKW